jgi:hypothetical protein
MQDQEEQANYGRRLNKRGNNSLNGTQAGQSSHNYLGRINKKVQCKIDQVGSQDEAL